VEKAVAAAVLLWLTTSAGLAGDELAAYLLWGESAWCAPLGEGIITGERWMTFA
jgi:hypothetical protein